MCGEYIMNTDRLQRFLGENYEGVIRYTIADAFADCFKTESSVSASVPLVQDGRGPVGRPAE
jgi:hypothetical protein